MVTHPTFPAAGERPAPLIGRRLELGWLRTRLHMATHGFAQLVLVEGETGIGKTRLVDELLDDARRGGMRVVRGRCYEHLDLAYLPLRDPLFTMLAREFAGRAGREADLALLERVAAVEPDTAGPAPHDERERTRQMLALTRLVIELARDRPTVLSVDDVHWADPATVDLLRHLVFRFADEDVGMLLVATARADARARAAEEIAALRREPRCAPLELHALSDLEATDLARELRRPVTLDEARRIAGASGGNPLLVQALVRDPAPASWAAPVGGPEVAGHPVAAAIEGRLGALPPEAATVARAASFLGPGCTRPVVASITGLDPTALDAAIVSGAELGVLTDDGTAIGFTHPVYAHTAYEQTPVATRLDLHRRIAEVLLATRARGEAVSARTVTHHLVRAGTRADREVVAELAREAADDATTLAAWGEAARDLEAVIDARAGSADAEEMIELHRQAALAHRHNLDLARAIDHFDRAIELCDDRADLRTLVELRLWRIRCAVGSRDLLPIVRDRQPLVDLVDRVAAEAPALAAEALVEVSQSYWVDGRMGDAEAAARRAMELASSSGHHAAFARATMTLCVPQWSRYDLAESLRDLEAGVEHARLADDRSELAGGPLFRLPLVLTWLGRLDEAEARAQECCALADEMNYPLEEGLPLAALTYVATARGDFDAAERHAHQALLVQRLSGYHWAAGLFVPALLSACVARGRFDGARDALDAWAEGAGPQEALAILLLRRYVDAMERRAAIEGEPLPHLPRVPAVGADAWAAATVEIARREGAAGDLSRAYDLLAEVDRRGGVWSSGLVALVPRVLGVAADLLGRPDEAVTRLRDALEVAETARAEPEHARGLVDLAMILAREGGGDEARRLARTAAETFERLAMHADAERAEELLGYGVHRRGSVRPDATRAAAHTVLLFTDVVDSTRLTEELGNDRYRDLARRLEDALTTTVAAHGGTVMPGINLGDGILALFPSVRRALDAARRSTAEAAAIGLHLHVAVNAGEVIVDGSRLYGTPVNLAARLCAMTGPDEILVSQAVHDAAAAAAGVAFVDRGEHELKGIAEPQRVFALVDAIRPVDSPSAVR